MMMMIVTITRILIIERRLAMDCARVHFTVIITSLQGNGYNTDNNENNADC